ncbi:MAG: mannitol dehydrogenase family protein [Defluviitaleaceae bacterium]|nr:mannitol dehydrogenase family protein [Defluviitaleaceae bacterium]
MNLSLNDLSNPAWLESGYTMPCFDIAKSRQNAIECPVWLHFGAGSIFRAFPAAIWQKLLDGGVADTGISVCETFDEGILKASYTPYDNLSVAVTLKAGGGMDKAVIASVAEAFTVSEGEKRLIEIFEAPSLQMVSYTVTEAGYRVGPELERDAARGPVRGPAEYESLMGLTAAMLFRRYKGGAAPVAMVSMDNCSQNGDKLLAGVAYAAEKWAECGQADAGFPRYVRDPQKVSFPLSMIDKITPRPSEIVAEALTKDGLQGMEIVKTEKNTYTAAFVNAEEVQYLVAEDSFPNGRPPLDNVGVIFTDRHTVEKTEMMKVCTCLNPIHTILGVFGCLLGYRTISATMGDAALVALVKKAGYDEGMPVVVDPGIISPMSFIGEVLEKRLPNPFIPDTPERIACDTSLKIPVRFGETMKAYKARGLDVSGLEAIPFFFAGWIRYLMGVGDDGKELSISPDPRLPELREHVKGFRLGNVEGCSEALRPVLSDAGIFGLNLYECGLVEKTEGYFASMAAGVGAVRKALDDISQVIKG